MPGQLTGGRRSAPKPATNTEQHRATLTVADAYGRGVIADPAATKEILVMLGLAREES